MESMLPDTDNFFKYLLSIGLILILFAIIYPLKKEQQLKVEAIEISMRSDQLRNDISQLKSQSTEFEKYAKVTQRQIDDLDVLLKKAKQKDFLEIQKQKLDIKKTYDEKKGKILTFAHDLEDKNISLRFQEKKHEEIKSQIWDYAIFKAIFWILGILFSCFGFIFWVGSAYLDEFIKGGHNLGSGYKSSYVKCLNFLREKKIISFTLFIIASIILSLLYWFFTRSAECQL